jgi:hypothetical protein
MAVKRCPSCGDLYLAAVDACADCGATLGPVEEPTGERESRAVGGEADAPIEAAGGEGHSTWSLETWTMEGRRLLDGMLANADIPRTWQGSTLVAPGPERARVQEMVDTVGAGDARVGADAAALAAVDAGAAQDETVGYEVSDWPDEALDRLSAMLDDRSVPHGWDDDGDLVVSAAHEETVDALFSELSDDGDPLDQGGPDALELLSELFLAADRLARNALDSAAARAVHSVAQQLATRRLPFGFVPAVWSDIVSRAAQLSAAIDDDELDDDQLEADAAALRDTVRDYV